MNNEPQKSPSSSPSGAPMNATQEADFSTFMRKYQNMVFSTAARLTANDAQAEDIAQEVFIKAYEHFDALRDAPAAPGWLRTVATNLSLNHLQRYRKRWRFFSEFTRGDDGSAASDSSSDVKELEWAAPDTFFDSINTTERNAWIERALATLPEHQRVPIILFHFEEMPYDQIAKKLNVSLAKLKVDILRGRRALASALTRDNAGAFHANT